MPNPTMRMATNAAAQRPGYKFAQGARGTQAAGAEVRDSHMFWLISNYSSLSIQKEIYSFS